MHIITLVKVLHIFFVISWFAGIFYLPRLFVNHAMVEGNNERQLLTGMEARLIKMMHFAATMVILTGLWLLYLLSGGFGADYFRQGWLHAKITLVAVLLGYHYWCVRIHKRFAQNREKRNHVWFRWFNEMPVFVLLAILWLVLAKPF